jgi:hypothetical protein
MAESNSISKNALRWLHASPESKEARRLRVKRRDKKRRQEDPTYRENLKRRRKATYLRNKASILKKSRELYQLKKDEIIKRRRRYVLKNREMVNRKAREFHERNRERILEQNREKRRSNPEKFHEYERNAVRRRTAREMILLTQILSQRLNLPSLKKLCKVCGNPVTAKYATALMCSPECAKLRKKEQSHKQYLEKRSQQGE